jgi:DNA-binding PadR family transcriptional regulator
MGVSELGRRVKFYRLTPRGRRHLTAQTAELARFAHASEIAAADPSRVRQRKEPADAPR